MSLRTIPVSEATPKDLRYYATTVLGLDGISPNLNGASLIAKIEGVLGHKLETIQCEEAAAPPAPAAAPAPAPAAAAAGTPDDFDEATFDYSHRGDPKVGIQIPAGAGDFGERPVEVAVEGVNFMIERDKDVMVPHRVYEALKNAVEDRYDPPKKVGDPVVHRKALSYPFNVTVPAAAEAVAKRNRDIARFEQLVERRQARARAAEAAAKAAA